MGKRTIYVGTSALVAFMKAHDGATRTYTIKNPLPDDARVVEERWLNDVTLAVVVESATWAGVDDRPMPPPEISVHINVTPREGIPDAEWERAREAAEYELAAGLRDNAELREFADADAD